MEAPVFCVQVKDVPLLMNTLWSVSVLPHWLFIIGWKVQVFQISVHMWQNLRTSWQMVLVCILISCSLSVLRGKKGDWEWTWSFSQNILTIQVLVSSVQMRLFGLETCSENGILMTVTCLVLMNSWTSFYWIFTTKVSYRNFWWRDRVSRSTWTMLTRKLKLNLLQVLEQWSWKLQIEIFIVYTDWVKILLINQPFIA